MPSLSSSIFAHKKAHGDQISWNSSIQKSVGGITFIFGILIMTLAFLYVKEPCDNPAIYFLLFLGTVHFSSYIISQLSPDDITLPFLALLELGLLIWGSFAILSEYTLWQYTIQDQQGYCPRVPYLTAFVYLVAHWILMGVVVIVGCLSLLVLYVVMAFNPENWRESTQTMEIFYELSSQVLTFSMCTIYK